VLQADTPAQRYFAAKGEYAVLLSVAVAYAESPSADPAVVQQLTLLDSQAQSLFAKTDRQLADPSVDRATAAEAAASVLEGITAQLRALILRTHPDLSSTPSAGRIAPLLRHRFHSLSSGCLGCRRLSPQPGLI